MDLNLTPELEAFRQEARAWLDAHLVGEFADHRGVGFSSDDIAWDVRLAWDRELAAGGWLCMGWPEEYGGRGLSIDKQLVWELENAKADSPYRATAQGQDLLGPTLLAFGTEEQKKRFLPPITRAEEFWGQGFSEPGSGSDLASLRTKARLQGDEWVIHGQKIWTSIAARADWLYVLARTDPDAPRHAGISLLLVPVDQPGVEIRTIRNIVGGDDFCEVFLDGARTTKDMVVGGVNNGWGVAMGALGTERGTTLLGEHLRVQREVEVVISEARRTGRADSAVFRDEAARAWTAAKIIEWNGRRLIAALKGVGGDGTTQASVGKVFASAHHQEIGRLGMRVQGAAGALVGPDYTVNRLQNVYLQAFAETIYGGATQIQLNVLSERVLGMPREPRPA